MMKILKRKNKKGFTLMEMLIVIGIIAILVAIAIPTFSGAQRKAQNAADLANVRSWYAEVLTKNMTEEKDLPTSYDGPALKNGTVTIDGGGKDKPADKFKVTYTSKETDKTKFPTVVFPTEPESTTPTT